MSTCQSGKERINAAKNLMGIWFNFIEKMTLNKQNSKPLVTLLHELTFQNVVLEGKNTNQNNRVSKYIAKMSLPNITSWFVPPEFGSDSENGL